MQLTETITWIPVAERLPDADLTVLVFNSETVEMAWHNGDAGWIYCESGGVAEGITHWAEIPQGPQP